MEAIDCAKIIIERDTQIEQLQNKIEQLKEIALEILHQLKVFNLDNYSNQQRAKMIYKDYKNKINNI